MFHYVRGKVGFIAYDSSKKIIYHIYHTTPFSIISHVQNQTNIPSTFKLVPVPCMHKVSWHRMQNGNQSTAYILTCSLFHGNIQRQRSLKIGLIYRNQFSNIQKRGPSFFTDKAIQTK